MKRSALVFLTAGFIAFVCAAASSAQAEDGCTREDLTKIADEYFVSIREHKASDLPLASTVKFTENGVKTDVGKGFWETSRQAHAQTRIDRYKEMRDGKVDLILSIVGPSAASMGWPLEPIE